MPPEFSPIAITIKNPGGGLTNVIKSDIKIGFPNSPESIKIKGIWDTGATSSVITKRVVKELGLNPSGKSEVHTANGSVIRNRYIVNVIIHANLNVEGVTVTDADALSDCDALIGMDIITMGDFSITNFNGNTVMSFRFPSQHEIDYEKEI
jgi:predicted aspartyl protease